MTTFDEDEKGIPIPECLFPEAPTAETARSDGPALDRRLRTACDLLPEESVVWDIGTDHAYIPIYLLRCGKCTAAVASDINRGPLGAAKRNAELYGVSERITFLLTNGLGETDPAAYGVTDLCICGMGGELIAEILRASPYLPQAGLRLVLQPMSHGYDLRCALRKDGYTIREERLCKANGKIYAVIAAEYTGAQEEYTEAELLLGRQDRTDPLWQPYVIGFRHALEKKRQGRIAGRLDTAYEDALALELDAYLAESKKIIEKRGKRV